MNQVLQFWNSRFSFSRSLEADSWLGRVANRHVVGTLMNVFPKGITKVLSLSKGEFARLLLVEKEGGSYRTLRAMYEYVDPRNRGDLINRLLMQSPGVKAARNRRNIGQRMLQTCLEGQAADKPVLVLSLGGGDGRLELEVVSKVARRDIYHCVVDKDERAVEENRKTANEFGVAGRSFVFLGNIAEKDDLVSVLDTAGRRFGVQFDGADVAVCHGIAEYLDMGSKTNEMFSRTLRAVLACVRDEGNLIISQTDYHDRVRWVEQGLGWYMRLRDIEEVTNEVEKAGWQVSLCEHEPMGLITMCMAVKSVRPYRRVDSPSHLRRVRARQLQEQRARVMVGQ